MRDHPAFGAWHGRRIDALNGFSATDAEYRRYDRVLISRITWMEVRVGEQGDEALVCNPLGAEA